MFVAKLVLRNWRNFREVDTPLSERQFVVGPNASGKSNLLDVFRFLRDVAAADGGGLQKAVRNRGGVSKLRCLAARSDPKIAIEVHIAERDDEAPVWRYRMEIGQETRGYRQPILAREAVWRGGEPLLDRPDDADRQDPERLKQTHLEQVNANAEFRDIARFFQSITYLHLVPQLLRHPEIGRSATLDQDPFGQGFLDRVARTSPRSQETRLRKIEDALKIAVPQLQQLRFERDEATGQPHLAALYAHWRPNAGWQREDQFSDGTLRLIGLLWSLLDGESPLLLEEPELSLNDGVVRHLAGMIHRLQRQRRRQVLVSTHSTTLLNDEGIGGEEILMLRPGPEGTTAERASDVAEIAALLEGGLPPGDIVIAKTRRPETAQLGLFE
jgi:predicted ATPase